MLRAGIIALVSLRGNSVMNRLADWLHQAQADLAQAELGAATGPQRQRLPLSCDALVLTPAELQELLAGGDRMARELRRDLRWFG